jgi:hypothetical protein
MEVAAEVKGLFTTVTVKTLENSVVLIAALLKLL